MPKNLPHYPTLYITRFQMKEERQAKIDIGAYVASELIEGSPSIFVSGGTTAAIAGLEVLCRHPDVNVMTHSIPVVWHLMEFKHRKLLDESVSIEVVGGHVDCMTGVITHGRLGKLASEIFIYAPRCIDKRGVSSNHNETAIEEAWKSHAGVILLATHTRLLEKTGEIVKYVGMIRKGTKNKRTCALVVPETFPERFTNDDKKRTAEILEEFEKNKVTIHKAPRCKKSQWYDYFKNSPGK